MPLVEKVFHLANAGGVGVNLQSANVLINLDLPWNPAVLEQRIGRIYRLGQKNHVSIYNFITKKSIEHRILYLLEFKKSVFKGAIEEEGEDSVMLEGFLESVKALTEVNFEEKNNDVDYTPDITQHKIVDNLAEENNRAVLEKYGSAEVKTIQEEIKTNQQDVKVENNENGKGLFSRLKKRLHRFFNR